MNSAKCMYFCFIACRFVPVGGPVRSSPPCHRADSTRSDPGRAVPGQIPRHVGLHDPAQSVNGSCLAQHYLDRA
jgi:hypothetical protein